MTTVTLTFDNGPDPDVTPIVLDTLRRREISATFFVLGDKMRDRRGLAERAHAEGHWIGNHTYNHLVPLGLSAEPGLSSREIADTQDLIGALSHERRLFRPFGGGGALDRRLLNPEAVNHLEQGRYTCVLWNAVPEDWAYPTTWVERALDLCLHQEHAVLVLHDLPTGAMTHLDRFVSAALDTGVTFTQQFPAACIPIEQGRQVSAIKSYVTGGE